MSDRPVILFACVHNRGRSLAAKLLAEHHRAGRVDVRSAGSDPGEALDPTVVQVLEERGLSTDGEHPKLLTHEGVQAADVVVTMGCGETCPVFPGTTYEDWPLDDPTGQDIDTVRRIVGEVEQRVLDLLARITWSSRAREQADAERATGLETV
jgi:arsenate reductase